ncbi:phospholipase D family protein [Pseudomonas coleopterorum]|uniref:phospholipase D family nuclease n=1 Tax=Pseudomonas coleopterorum TaxID=1605838 RepID=UPI000899E160|nr:phospholipase D family protein [Pseudomonas coleopterorum]SEE90030.1 PLD-like domain-containing protein [Pseudomonas coleopterorum]
MIRATRRFLIPAPIGVLFLIASAVQAAQVEVGFSPEGSAETLVVNVIQKAEHQVLLMGYSFTSPSVVKALIAAKRRGVDVQVVLDARGNEGKSSQAAMNLIAHAGIAVRTNAAYKIQHDKVIITDGRNVETGSFNYSSAAAHSNSENALVLWDVPDVAKVYTQHWQSRWDKGQAYQAGY